MPGGISTVPLRHPVNAEEDVCSVFLLVATSAADCELDVQFAIKNQSWSKRRSTIAASIAMPVAISVSRPGEYRADNESEALTCND